MWFIDFCIISIIIHLPNFHSYKSIIYRN